MGPVWRLLNKYYPSQESRMVYLFFMQLYLFPAHNSITLQVSPFEFNRISFFCYFSSVCLFVCLVEYWKTTIFDLIIWRGEVCPQLNTFSTPFNGSITISNPNLQGNRCSSSGNHTGEKPFRRMAIPSNIETICPSVYSISIPTLTVRVLTDAGWLLMASFLCKARVYDRVVDCHKFRNFINGRRVSFANPSIHFSSFAPSGSVSGHPYHPTARGLWCVVI